MNPTALDAGLNGPGRREDAVLGSKESWTERAGRMRGGRGRAGLVIALSGVECAGKSTQRDLLLGALRARGCQPVTIWTRPGYTPGLEALKRLVSTLRARGRSRHREGRSQAPGLYPRRAANLGHPVRRRLWLVAALLDLLWTYGLRLRMWRRRGLVVVCDRFLLDCLVDFRVNFPEDRVEQGFLGRCLRRLSARPDAAFCLMIPPALSIERAHAKARFHWETAETLERRVQEYLAASAELSVQVLDGTLPADEVRESIERGLDRAVARVALAAESR
jgi:thymidylate kinase